MELAISVIMAILALCIHELAHVFFVRYFGGKVEKVALIPMGIFAKFVGLEKLSGGERYIVYGAGCMANLFAAGWFYSVSRLSYMGIPWMECFAFINLVLAMFNLLPALPLDGGRILHQFLCNRVGFRKAGRILKFFATFFGVIFVVLGSVYLLLYLNVVIFAAGVFIIKQNKAIMPRLAVDFLRALDAKNFAKRARLIPVRRRRISENTSISKAFSRLTIDYFTEFWIKEKECTLSEVALLVYIFEHGLNGDVADLFSLSQASPAGRAACD